MAINTLEIHCNKPTTESHCSSNSSKTGAGNPSSRLVKINFATEGSICSTATSWRGRKKKNDAKSPYLVRDTSSVHLHSQVTEKTMIQQKGSKFVSSFPLAVNIYKANSDEFKSLKKANRKAKKSVLTLPNEPAPIPKTCTVSDMNDSEYFNQYEDRKKVKKRTPRTRQIRPKVRDYEFYDRDARYCSQMNLDCSSTDLIKFNGSTRQNGKTKSVAGSKQQAEEKTDPHDVWAVLRNINRFQFRPSPPMSDDSFVAPKKKKGPKRRNNRKDMRVVETCRTEEFAYISSIEVDDHSRSSSFDRITVIDKQDDFSKMCEEFEKIVTANDFARGATIKPRLQNYRANSRNAMKPNTRGLTLKTNNPKALPIEYNSKKQWNGNSGDTLHTKLKKLRGNRDIPTMDDTDKHEFDIPLYADETNETQTCENGEEPMVQNEFIYSGSSSKALCLSQTINKGGKSRNNKQHLPTNEPNQQLKGITKVVLSKGSNQDPPMTLEQPKLQRPGISASQPENPKITNDMFIPKLTQADIKRRLAKLKFPIVILGKDQLSSSYEVSNPAPVQFDGLNEQIWPFMLDWQTNGDKQVQPKRAKNIDQSQKNKINAEILAFNKAQKINRGLIPSKPLNTDKKPAHDSKNNNKIKVEHKRVVPPAELIEQSQQKRVKSIRQLKEKMIKLLYKNSLVHTDDAVNKQPNDPNSFVRPASKMTSNKVDEETDTRVRIHCKEVPRNPINSPVKNIKPVPIKPWAKARWASDFIDNVIKKIKNGVYYTHESKFLNQNHNLLSESKEAEIQTVSTNTDFYPAMNSISKITIKKKSDTIAIPGFDNTQPALEIKTMNCNEIAVKHCVTNILVRFDVTVPNEPVLNLRKSVSLIPLDVTGSETKIFKCKTSILNSMLPAELCSILPKLMWNIIESNRALTLPVVIEKPASQLSTISEIRHCEGLEPFKAPWFPQLRMTPTLLNLLNGIYKKVTHLHQKTNKKVEIKFNIHFAEELLPRVLCNRLFGYVADPTKTVSISVPKPALILKEVIPRKVLNTCMALERYPVSDRRLVPATAFKRFDISSFLLRMKSYVTDNITLCSRAFNSLFDKNLTINLIQTNSEGLQDTISINISSLMVNAFDSTKVGNGSGHKYLPAIQCSTDLKESLAKKVDSSSSVNKTKKKGFVKLYRKCKSTTNISAERTSTALSKITNLEDFFQALGTKLFPGVFDNHYTRKILSSLKEMKNWITDINPTQALLVLLLMSKKDTANLVRFRPVLLQGIAVNRITRANELDMEIEVIEREHLNRLSQYDGMSYSPELVENQDNLLEELYWIAKTTASDYQRPFDENSEKLLKSLLHKRKKLNPSYLRVMARYVGLGLLKTPIKK